MQAKVDLMRKLLFEDRILVSGVKCPKLVATFQGLRRGRAEGTVAPASIYRHYFDAASYPIIKVCSDEIQNMARQTRANSRKLTSEEQESNLVSVPL